MKYRPEIDGLRAIAVLLVIIFHAGLTALPSGFIGVDMFFVISGYLVSSVIASALQAGSFSFSSFFARRLWRLQPAIILLLIITLLIASLVYLPDDFVAYLKSAKYTSLFTSNQYFERVTTRYAGPDTAELLLLHTWSLSIEWQWYGVLPVALWLLYRYCPARLHRAIIGALTVASVALALLLSRYFPDKSYYFFSARIFEFLIGVSAASFTGRAVSLSMPTRTALSFASLGTLIYVAVQPGLLLGFPDSHAVAVCLATAWLLMAGSDKTFWATRLLSCKPLVFIGTISYSLYLWHWPVFATGHYLGFDSNPAFIAAGLFLTFAVSWISYVTVERRFRRSNLSLGTSVLLLWLLPALFLVVLYSQANKHEGFPGRFGKELTSVLATLKASEAADRESCLGQRDGTSDQQCTVGAQGAETTSLLIGDSFSNQYWGFMDVLGKAANTSFLVHGTSSCLALPGVYLFDWWTFKNTVYSECHDNTQNYYDLIKTHRYRYVAIGQIWGNYEGDHLVSQPGDPRSVELSHARAEAALDEALRIITGSGAQPVVIKATAPMPEGFASCFYQHFKLRKQIGQNDCQSESGPVPRAWFDGVFERMQGKYPQLIVIDPKDVQCDKQSCLTAIDGVPVYRDVGHITDFASYTFGRWYLERFSNPLK
ncbi:acyltransferase family protein [Pseudomonas sp. NPDC087358]|uniref:acyltransferase family protein n=1 Tax=Pseudomonas sp. NPDC087358 TaxID=3364439 RepID=UPI00384F3CE7